MALQSSVRFKQAFGVPGSFFNSSPRRVAPYNVYTASSEAVKAVGSVAFGSTNASANDTVSIGGQVYTFKSSLTAATTANEVLIGDSVADSVANLAAAVNKGTGGGTKYGSETVKNAWAVASIGTTTTTLTLTAITAGAQGNSIALSASVATATAFANGSDGVYAPAYVGYAFSVDPSSANKAQAGNTNSGTFAGILVTPKQYANYANLAPSMEVKDGMIGELCTFGELIVQSAHTVKPGYLGCFRNSDGKIGAATASNAVPEGYTLIPHATYQYYDGEANGMAVLVLGD